MAHEEIAHVAARHATRQVTRRAVGRNIGTISIDLCRRRHWLCRSFPLRASPWPMTFSKFSPVAFESEADFLWSAVHVQGQVYDPQALLSASSKSSRQKEKRKPGTLARAFATHPQTPDRIEKSQAEIGTILSRAARNTSFPRQNSTM